MNLYDEHECPVCKKMFLITDVSQWAYKMSHKGRIKMFCSWSCLRKHEREEDEKRKSRKHTKWLAKEI